MDKIITIKPNEPIEPSKVSQVISNSLYSGASAKFITDTYYIQFNFSKFGGIYCSSNIRNPQFIRERNYYETQGWTPPKCAQFVYQWMSLYRGNLY